jgi:hypothetical protein
MEAPAERTATPLGSFTSGVDGSSEGGRINTSRLPYNLVLYGVPLLREMRRRGYAAKLDVAPMQVDGIWCLKLTYPYDQKAPKAPELWHGHRVIVAKGPPPPPPEEKKPA